MIFTSTAVNASSLPARLPGRPGGNRVITSRNGQAAQFAANKALYFASNGMRPDLMEQYAAAGAKHAYASLIANGVRRDNGLVQGFPPNTGVGWYTLATGTYPGEHGSTNNTYFRTGENNFNNRTSFSAAGTLQPNALVRKLPR